MSLIADRLTNELLGRGRALNLDSLRSFTAARRVCLGAAVLIVGRFTNELLGRDRALNLDPAQSLLKAARVCLGAAVLVVVGRFLNEVLMCGCTRVVLNVGSRNRAVENVRWGAIWRTALVPRYAGYVVVLCGTFLCADLYGICAAAVSASVKLPTQTKRLAFIISLLFNFVNQTPVAGRSCAASSR